MNSSRFSGFALSTLLFACLAVDAFAAPTLYWSEPGEVNATPLAAFSKQQLVGGPCLFYTIKYDALNDYLYGYDAVKGKVLRMKPDGSGLQAVTETGLVVPYLALAPGSSKIFLAGQHVIYRANLDGSGLQEIVNTGSATIISMGIDELNEKLYWGSISGSNAYVQRANFDGSGVQSIMENLGLSVRNFAFDPENDRMYVANSTDIYVATLDGTLLDIVYEPETALKTGSMILDLENQTLYWTDEDGERLSSVNVYGGNHEEFMLTSENGQLPVLSFAHVPGSNSLYLYSWSNGLKLFQLSLDYFTLTTLYTEPAPYPFGLQILRRGAKLYWLEDLQSAIWRSNLDGTERELVLQGARAIGMFTLDEPGQKLYWSSPQEGKVYRAGLDGSNEEVVAEGLPQVEHVAADTTKAFLYYTKGSVISRLNLHDPSQVETLATGAQNLFDFALDRVAGKLYWGCYTNSLWKIERMNTDGSEREDVIVESSTQDPYSFTFDFQEGKIYWQNWARGVIERANPDGTAEEDLFPLAEPVMSLALLRDTALYGTWNTNLGMLDVLELANHTDAEFPVQVTLSGPSGQVLTQISIALAPGGQQDLLLNQLGLPADAYGSVKVDAFGKRLDGRVFMYAPATGANEFDFAVPSPLSLPLRGTSYVNSNTLSPGRQGDSITVQEWLALVNLESVDRGFTITTYNQEGSVIKQFSTVLPALSRMDFEIRLGELPGAALVKITPENGEMTYLAELFRYGNAGAGDRLFSASFSAKAPAAWNVLYAPLSTGGNADNWLEIVNSSADSADLLVDFIDQGGTTVASQHVSLPPYAQSHLYVNGALPAGSTGTARITPAAGSVIAQSMFYFVHPQRGALTSAYGSSAREGSAFELHNSYNLFLGMQNWLKLMNTTAETQTVTVRLTLPSGTETRTSRSLAPYGALDLGLHELQNYGMRADTYGTATVEAAESGAVFSELLRLAPAADGSVGFAASTAAE